MQKYVLDTNVFFNMEAGLGLGKSTKEVMQRLDSTVKEANGKLVLYMPPRIVEELLTFFENKEEPFVRSFLSKVVVQSPRPMELQFSATAFYELVEEVRKRSYRGLNIGEEEIERAAQTFMNTETLDKKTFQISVGEYIKKFRERYRNATRTGFLDSVADLDLIVLAYQLEAPLISTDEGVIYWARKFGVQEVPLSLWKKQLDDLSHHA